MTQVDLLEDELKPEAQSEPLYQKYMPVRSVRKWPWWLRWLAPHDNSELASRVLTKCRPCGRVMWLDAPKRIKIHHMGHLIDECWNANIWWFMKMKLGLLDKLTFGEWLKECMEKRHSA